MQQKHKSILDYLTSLIEDNKVCHFFKLFGDEKDALELAIEKAKELNGEYLITKNYSKTSIHVIITCSTSDWKTNLTNPVISTTIRRLCHAQ